MNYRSVKVQRIPCSLIVAAMLQCLFFCGGCAPKPPTHGTAYVLEIETNGVAQIDNALLAERQKILSKRLRNLGVSGAFVEPLAGARLQVKVPRLSSADPAMIRKTILTGGHIEFRLVHPESDQLIAASIPEPGYEILRLTEKQRFGGPVSRAYLVKKKPELSGKHISKAFVMRHPLTKEPQINFELDTEGAKIFEQVTTAHSPKGNQYFQLAIVLDGVLYSAPRILGPIPQGRGQITGSFSAKEALALANALENPFESPHRIIEEKTF